MGRRFRTVYMESTNIGPVLCVAGEAKSAGEIDLERFPPANRDHVRDFLAGARPGDACVCFAWALLVCCEA